MTDSIDLTGVHFVRTKRGPLKSRWQVYAWRSGPSIMTADQIIKPKLTPAALAALVKAQEQPEQPQGDTFPALADAYLASPEYRVLADYTRRDYAMWIRRAKKEFKASKIAFFDKPKFRRYIIEWRDKWDHAPRQRKYALQVLSAVLSWGAERGWLAQNPVRLIDKKHTAANRADIVWTEEEIAAVAARMKPHVARAFRLVAWTGLARGDLLALRWSEIGDLYISRRRHKTLVETVIPLFDQTRDLLAEFKAAWPKGVRPLTVVVNNRGKSAFTPRGFSRAVERARAASGVAQGKTLHDVRGTFATRLMDKGFSNEEIDEILGWKTGNSKRIRCVYISRRNVVLSAIERMRERTNKGNEK